MRRFRVPDCSCRYCFDKPDQRLMDRGRPDLMDTVTLIAWIDRELANTG